MKGKKKYLLLLLLIVALLWMFADAFFQPGINDLKSNFKEIVFLRNEQNTGPVIRLYVVSLKDTLWNEMETYGNYMPHSKYGTTKVYFFRESSRIPEKLFFEEGNFPVEYKPYCIGIYEKDGMSQVSIIKYPFTQQDEPSKGSISY